MNRTVRCLALFAIGVGAWACKGDPQSSLDRGTIAAVTADPARILVDQGSTTPVLIDARDNLNQAVEITSVTEVAGTGITFVRDFLFQPVFDAGATDQVSCDLLTNSSWTGAGCLVPRTNPTRLRYEITGTALVETSFSVTINGGTTVDIPVTVTLSTTVGTLSTETPVSGEDVTITLPSPLIFDPAVVADPLQWQGTVFIGVDDDGGPIDVGSISDLQATTVTFQFAPNLAGPVITASVLFPFNPAVPAQFVSTAETFISPQWPTPFAVTLSPASPVTGFDVVRVTAGAGLIFDQAAVLYIADAGAGCNRDPDLRDPSCVAANIVSRAPDGTSIDATFPQNNLVNKSVHVTRMAATAAPQFATLDGETDQAIAVDPTTFPVTVTQALPASGVGLEVVRLTVVNAGDSFSSAAFVQSMDDGSGGSVGFINVGVDPGGTWLDYVQAGGTTGTPNINGIVQNSVSFVVPIASPVTAAASTFPPLTTQAAAADITALLPAVGGSILWYDNLSSPGGNIFGTDQQFYNFSGPVDHTFVLDWDNSADIDILYADNPATAGFVCGGGATGAQPETSICVLGAGGWTFVVNLYAGATPSVLQLMITGN